MRYVQLISVDIFIMFRTKLEEEKKNKNKAIIRILNQPTGYEVQHQTEIHQYLVFKNKGGIIFRQKSGREGEKQYNPMKALLMTAKSK